MRTPTPHDVAYAWHEVALDDLRVGLDITATDEPQCGFFRRRLTRGGVFVAARIFLAGPVDLETGELLEDEVMICEVAGSIKPDVGEEWPWLWAQPISEQEFRYMEATRLWAAWHSPRHPAANPRKSVDWLNAPIPDFTGG